MDAVLHRASFCPMRHQCENGTSKCQHPETTVTTCISKHLSGISGDCPLHKSNFHLRITDDLCAYRKDE